MYAFFLCPHPCQVGLPCIYACFDMFWWEMCESMSGFVADLARFQPDSNTCQALADTLSSMWAAKTSVYGSYMFTMDPGNTCVCLVPANSTCHTVYSTWCDGMCMTLLLHDLNPQNWSIFLIFLKSKNSFRKSFSRAIRICKKKWVSENFFSRVTAQLFFPSDNPWWAC